MKTLISSLAALLVLGCTGGSETGNPATPAQMGLSLHTSDPGIADIRAGAQGVVVDSAWIGMRDVSFVLADPLPEDMEDIEIEGLVVTDLTDPRGGLQQFLLVPGVYSGLQAELVQVALPLPVGAPPELEGSSVVVFGFTPTGRRFQLVIQGEMELAVDADSLSFTIDETTSDLALSFDVARWFTGLDLDALDVSPDGTVRLDDANNTDALLSFEANLVEALELGFDRNGNARLDDGEERLARGVAP